jgi:F0F1-type ATP synthase assembly protein I
VIHQLINFYMITHLLLGLGEGVNRIVEGNL